MKQTLAFSLGIALISVSALAKGPVGYGALKLGLTKESVESLQSGDGIYLSGAMTPYEYKNTSPKPGEDEFDALLVTPLAAAPLKSVLTFEGGQLSGLYLTLEQSSNMLEQITSQITEKYGPGAVEDNRKEEQCIYKNGANFKLKSGAVHTRWSQEVSKTEKIETTVSDISIEMCPSNLRYGKIGPIKLRSLTIRRLNIGAEPKSKNLF